MRPSFPENLPSPFADDDGVDKIPGIFPWAYAPGIVVVLAMTGLPLFFPISLWLLVPISIVQGGHLRAYFRNATKSDLVDERARRNRAIGIVVSSALVGAVSIAATFIFVLAL